MEIKQIDVNSDDFYKICGDLEEEITKQNLVENGGTLNYYNLTYESDILLVAYDGNKPIGYNSVIITQDGYYYIYQIAIKKEYQQKGIGRSLMEKVIDMATRNNTIVTANVMNYNKNSIKMFTNLGFTKIYEDKKNGNGFYTSNVERIINDQEKYKESNLKP